MLRLMANRGCFTDVLDCHRRCPALGIVGIGAGPSPDNSEGTLPDALADLPLADLLRPATGGHIGPAAPPPRLSVADMPAAATTCGLLTVLAASSNGAARNGHGDG